MEAEDVGSGVLGGFVFEEDEEESGDEISEAMVFKDENRGSEGRDKRRRSGRYGSDQSTRSDTMKT